MCCPAQKLLFHCPSLCAETDESASQSSMSVSFICLIIIFINAVVANEILLEQLACLNNFRTAAIHQLVDSQPLHVAQHTWETNLISFTTTNWKL